jgi:hypothetical protein
MRSQRNRLVGLYFIGGIDVGVGFILYFGIIYIPRYIEKPIYLGKHII